MSKTLLLADDSVVIQKLVGLSFAKSLAYTLTESDSFSYAESDSNTFT